MGRRVGWGVHWQQIQPPFLLHHLTGSRGLRDQPSGWLLLIVSVTGAGANFILTAQGSLTYVTQ